MLNFDDALSRIIDAISPLKISPHPLHEAAGHYLGAPLVAQLTQPPFNASGMDGYAVRVEDVADRSALEVVGESQAGAGFDGGITNGQTVRIFTGAPVPQGADAVIMQEHAERQGNQVRFTEIPRPGQNVRPAGQDFANNDVLLEAGTRLGPVALALAAASGNAQLQVHNLPNVALIATGNELVRPGDPLGAGQIVASNGYGLKALFAPHCANIVDLGIARDTMQETEQAVQAALDADADIIVTTGGASVGDHDLIQPVFKNLGIEIDFWKIAMRPGKPLLFGTKGSKVVFGLPGNPVSSMVTATMLVLPALRALAGAARPANPMLRLPLAEPLAPNGPRRHFVRGTLKATDKGTAVAPINQTDSAHLSSFAQAEVLIVHHEKAPAMSPGELVDAVLIDH